MLIIVSVMCLLLVAALAESEKKLRHAQQELEQTHLYYELREVRE